MVIKKPASLKSQAYESIRDAVINHKVKQNVIYSEQWFADNFEISRTPVREALLQLRAEDLIEVLPNRGVIVKPLTLPDARNIFQTRIAIEGYCASYLACHAEEMDAQETLNRVEHLMNCCHVNFNRQDEVQFHVEILKYNGNPEFLEQFNHMRAKIDVFWNEVVSRNERPEEAYWEHKKILDCMRSCDALGAYKASADHMLMTFRSVQSSHLFDDLDDDTSIETAK